VESAVEWYDTLQKTLLIYLVPLTPLDCVIVKMGYEALCIPGTGLTRYPVAARVLLELLPRLLPKTDDEVTSIINMVRMESNNGYDLLWRILELTVPGFDPTVPVTLPTWSDDGIFDFAHAFLLYYRLLSKKGEFHDNKTRSTTFLQAIKDYAFAVSFRLSATPMDTPSHRALTDTGNRVLLTDTGTRVALTDTGNRVLLTDTGNRVLTRTQNCGLVAAPILDHKGVQPPPEPPPTPILDHADVGPPPEPPPECTVAVTRLTILCRAHVYARPPLRPTAPFSTA
jgi:hypothetical protein